MFKETKTRPKKYKSVKDGHQALSAMLCRPLEIGVEWSLIADQWSNLRHCHETRDFFQTDNV